MSQSIGNFSKQIAQPGVIPAQNSVASGEGYHVSLNDRDLWHYGDVTTALVIGQGELFLILNGDHRMGFAKASESGFEGCLTYFDNHIAEANKCSDHQSKTYRFHYWTLKELCSNTVRTELSSPISIVS